MKKLFYFASSALLLLASCQKQAKYELVWADEFDGTEVNDAYWNLEDNARGGGNAELQYFTPKNAAIETHPATGESCLVLNAQREDFYYTAADGEQGYRPATSVRMNTQDKMHFTYGKIEARIAFPYTGNGLWPAFWMLGNNLATDLGDDDSVDDMVEELAKQGRVVWPKCGEIDICEMGHVSGIEMGLTDRRFNGAAHWGESFNNGQYPNTAGFTNTDYPVQGDFHTWTVFWEEDTLAMYFDLMPNYDFATTDSASMAKPYFALSLRNKEINEPGHYFNHDFYLLFNLSVGGFFPGMPNPDKYSKVVPAELLEPVTALPADGTPVKMYVDYVRVYQKQ